MELLNHGELTRELKAAVQRTSAAKASAPAAMAEVVGTVVEHLAVRVGAELARQRSTLAALGEVVQNLPARFAELEARLAAVERK